ncbi:hypothetical protein ACWDFL_32380 [Streptomyces bungoensis]
MTGNSPSKPGSQPWRHHRAGRKTASVLAAGRPVPLPGTAPPHARRDTPIRASN